MAEKDSAKGVESAEVVSDLQRRIRELEAALGRNVPTGIDPDRYGTRLEEDEHDKAEAQAERNAKRLAPKSETGQWVPVQVADEIGAHYEYEHVWVEHHGVENGHWANGELHKWVEETA
jgi:hypothetical protein